MKRNGKISCSYSNNLGVNQGGIASGLLFRKYLSDLNTYLNSECGVCIQGDILLHLLWADDLVLVSGSATGLQRQLNSLSVFCKRNHMLVNESKTKFLVFGKHNVVRIFYDNKEIEQAQQYKYLGVIISSTRIPNSDIFKCNYKYLADQAKKAIFAMQKKIRPAGNFPPHIMLYIFNAIAKPILTYGAEVWGCSK